MTLKIDRTEMDSPNFQARIVVRVQKSELVPIRVDLQFSGELVSLEDERVSEGSNGSSFVFPMNGRGECVSHRGQ